MSSEIDAAEAQADYAELEERFENFQRNAGKALDDYWKGELKKQRTLVTLYYELKELQDDLRSLDDSLMAIEDNLNGETQGDVL